MKSVYIPNLSSLSNNVFKGCSNIDDVYTEMQKAIPENAFDEITYNNAMLHIPVGQFDYYKNKAGWKNFKNITDGITTEEFHEGMIFSAKTAEGVDMVFEVRDAENKTCWVGCDNGSQAISTSTTGTVTIPSFVNGCEVKGICSAAFMDCNELTGIVVPEGIDSISYGAFAGCYSLTQIELPNSLKFFGEYVFYYCTNLKQIELPSLLEELGMGVFYGCSQLQSMFIPKNVKEIGDFQFSNCENLKTLSVSSDNPFFYSMNNCILADFNNIGVVCYGCAGSAIPTIPRVKQIGMYAFEEVTGMKEIVIPDNIEAIGHDAFAQCADLEKITIGRNVTLIQNYAFCGNTNLKQVYALNPVPVEINDNVFHTEVVWNENGSFNTSKDFTTATLYVPYGSKSAYQQAAGWKNFQNIVEMNSPDIATALDESSKLGAHAKHHCVGHMLTDNPSQALCFLGAMLGIANTIAAFCY